MAAVWGRITSHYGLTICSRPSSFLNLNELAVPFASNITYVSFVPMDDVKRRGIEALHRAIEGLKCKTAVHICYGYGIKANIDWKKSLGNEWRQYEEIFPALAKSRFDQVSVECINSRVPISLLKLLAGKDVLLGVIDVATDKVETAEEVAGVIAEAMKHVPKERLQPCTNCGMAPMDRNVAEAKLAALGAGAALARSRFG